MILAKLSINIAFVTTVQVFLKSLWIKNCKHFGDRSTMTFAPITHYLQVWAVIWIYESDRLCDIKYTMHNVWSSGQKEKQHVIIILFSTVELRELIPYLTLKPRPLSMREGHYSLHYSPHSTYFIHSITSQECITIQHLITRLKDIINPTYHWHGPKELEYLLQPQVPYFYRNRNWIYVHSTDSLG